MPHFGRRDIYIWGMGGMCTFLIVIGIMNPWTSNDKIAMAQAVLTLA